MELAEAQQLLEDVRNLEKTVARLQDAVQACDDQILEAKSERLVKSAKRGKTDHNKELRAAKNRLAEAKKAVKAMPSEAREAAEANPIVPQESVDAHAGAASAGGSS